MTTAPQMEWECIASSSDGHRLIGIAIFQLLRLLLLTLIIIKLAGVDAGAIYMEYSGSLSVLSQYCSVVNKYHHHH